MFPIRILLATVVALVVAASAAARPFPGVIALPIGFQPEGIAVGKGHTFFVGSIPTGAVYRGDLRTGSGAVLVPAQADRMAIGLAVDERNRIFVAGGTTGQGYVYDTRTGASLASFQLAAGPDPTFVNDVVVTKDAAWFTDSFRPVLYRLAIAPDGTLGTVTTVPLGGDFTFLPGGAFNANGIDATPDGKTLVIVQSSAGKLFAVDPATGTADEIELSGGNVAFGDGILLDGKTLYVVQNQLNQVAVVALSHDLSSGAITGHLTSPPANPELLQVPTTIAEFGNRLYAVNARFNLAEDDRPTAAYTVAQLSKAS
jgi:sugar lactone lactonase YvrE